MVCTNEMLCMSIVYVGDKCMYVMHFLCTFVIYVWYGMYVRHVCVLCMAMACMYDMYVCKECIFVVYGSTLSMVVCFCMLCYVI